MHWWRWRARIDQLGAHFRCGERRRRRAGRPGSGGASRRVAQVVQQRASVGGAAPERCAHSARVRRPCRTRRVGRDAAQPCRAWTTFECTSAKRRGAANDVDPSARPRGSALLEPAQRHLSRAWRPTVGAASEAALRAGRGPEFLGIPTLGTPPTLSCYHRRTPRIPRRVGAASCRSATTCSTSRR